MYRLALPLLLVACSTDTKRLDSLEADLATALDRIAALEAERDALTAELTAVGEELATVTTDLDGVAAAAGVTPDGPAFGTVLASFDCADADYSETDSPLVDVWQLPDGWEPPLRAEMWLYDSGCCGEAEWTPVDLRVFEGAVVAECLESRADRFRFELRSR